MTQDSFPTDAALLERAVRNVRPRQPRSPRWAAVAGAFGLGSSYAAQLCERFGLDPDDQLKRDGTTILRRNP
jgi:hypothetical protein